MYPYILFEYFNNNNNIYEIENEINNTKIINKRRLEIINNETQLIIKPYEIIDITFKFSEFFLNLSYYVDYLIIIQMNDKYLEMDSYIIDSIKRKVLNNKEVTLKLFNYNQEENHLTISVELLNIYDYIDEMLNFTYNQEIIRVLPSRAELLTNKIFPFIIFQNTFIDTKTVSTNFLTNEKTISLPFNFEIPNKNTTLITLVDLNITNKNISDIDLYNHGFSNNDPYSPQLFENNNLQYIFMPFFPYISSCYGYDKYLYLFDILENKNLCNIIDYEKIKIVVSNPFKGLYPLSDSCELNLTCKYDEYEQNKISNRWFSLVEKATLAYTTQEPIDIRKTFGNNFFGDNFNLDNLDKVSGIIPIDFIPHRKGNYNENCFPNNIVIDINYYHISQTKKKIYNIEVNMYDYINCKEQYSSSNNDIDEENNNNENNNNNFKDVYNLKINYKPMNYISLLNNYQFRYEVYFLLILIFTIIVFSLIFLIFYLIKKFINSKYLKYLNVNNQKLLIKYLFWPFIKGSSFGILILASLIALIIFNEKMKVFYVYSPTWDYIDLGGFESEVENNYYNKARVSLYFILSFLYLFYLSISIAIPKPDGLLLVDSRKKKLYKELNNIDNDKSLEDEDISNKNIKNNKKELLFSDDENSKKNEEKIKQFYDDKQVEITTVLSWKKRAVFFKYLLCLSYIVIKNYYIHLNGGLIIKSFIIIIIDPLIEEIILKFIFNEALLAAPLLVLNRVIKYITIIEIGGFIPSMIIYLLTTLFDSFLMIFIYPSIDKFEFFLSSKIHLFQLKYINKFAFKLIHKIVIVNNYLYNEEHWIEDYEKNLYKYLNKRDDEFYLEQILRINYIISIKLMSILFNPIIFIIFFYFKEETKIKDFFSLKEDKICIHFFLISLSLLIPEMAFQIVLINIIQIYYNSNINDYLNSCNIRYKLRENNIINTTDTMELHINQFWRSLDFFLFSEQFFFYLFINSSSLLLLFIGIMILSIYSYNPFGEPYLIFIIIIFFVCILVLHIVIELFKRLSKNNPSFNNRIGRNLEILEMEKKMDMKKLMTSEIVRNKFVKINKIWLIENLNSILDLEEDNNENNNIEEKEELNLKLKKIYQDALNYEYVEK